MRIIYLSQSLQREVEAKDAVIDGLQQQAKLLIATVSKAEQEDMDKKLNESRSLYDRALASLAHKMEVLTKSADALQICRKDLDEISGYLKEKRAQLDLLLKLPAKSGDVAKQMEKTKVICRADLFSFLNKTVIFNS